MILAGDVGGTKTLLGLFSESPTRPSPIEVGEFETLAYDGIESMIQEFLNAWKVEPRHILSTAIGVAGPVAEQVATMTNVPWVVDGTAVAARTGLKNPRILNDLEALAYAVPVLEASELASLQKGNRVPEGNAAVIAAGTGLGEAFLYYVGGRLVPGPSEGGHADFAARTQRDMDLVRELTPVFGRVSLEAIVSGPGLVNIYQVTHDALGTGPLLTPTSLAPARLCNGVGEVDDVGDLPARISQSGAEHRCPQCVEALQLFVSAYGAEAGNIALRGTATAGVFVGGGIAPKLLPILREWGFMEAFLAKQPMEDFVRAIPVDVILNDDAGLLGAAVYAQELVLRR